MRAPTQMLRACFLCSAWTPCCTYLRLTLLSPWMPPHPRVYTLESRGLRFHSTSKTACLKTFIIQTYIVQTYLIPLKQPPHIIGMTTWRYSALGAAASRMIRCTRSEYNGR